MRSFQSIFGRKEMNDNEPQSREYTGIIKLIHGEELVGKVLDTDTDDFFVVDSPFLLRSTVINTSQGEMFKVDLVPWLKFAKDEIFLLEKSKVFTVCEADERIKKLYNSTFRKYYLGDHATNKVDLSTYEGKIGSVEKTRKDLESLYHKDST